MVLPCGPPPMGARVQWLHTNYADYAGHYGLSWLAPVVQGYLRRLHNRTRGTWWPVRSCDAVARSTASTRARARARRGCELFDPARRTARLRATWGAGARTWWRSTLDGSRRRRTSRWRWRRTEPCSGRKRGAMRDRRRRTTARRAREGAPDLVSAGCARVLRSPPTTPRPTSSCSRARRRRSGTSRSRRWRAAWPSWRTTTRRLAFTSPMANPACWRREEMRAPSSRARRRSLVGLSACPGCAGARERTRPPSTGRASWQPSRLS